METVKTFCVNEFNNFTLYNIMIINEIKQEALGQGVPIIDDGALAELLAVVVEHKPKTILEVGTGVGYSGIAMLSAGGDKSEARLFTIEKCADRVKQANRNFFNAGLSKSVKIIGADAIDVLPSFAEVYLAGEKTNYVDFIFLDGPKAQYINYLPYLLEALRVGGILFADNVLYEGKESIKKKMQFFVTHITTNKNLRTSILDVGTGVSITQKLK